MVYVHRLRVAIEQVKSLVHRHDVEFGHFRGILLVWEGALEEPRVAMTTTNTIANRHPTAITQVIILLSLIRRQVQDLNVGHSRRSGRLTFDMSGGQRVAKRAVGRPLDGGVGRQRKPKIYRMRLTLSLTLELAHTSACLGGYRLHRP